MEFHPWITNAAMSPQPMSIKRSFASAAIIKLADMYAQPHHKRVVLRWHVSVQLPVSISARERALLSRLRSQLALLFLSVMCSRRHSSMELDLRAVCHVPLQVFLNAVDVTAGVR